ncbi:MAG TPA: farnesyl diphosphate synthase [Pseudomonadales bacterium]|nr:farnesyl diphosphate synthase [Pseudomonadales bacterium]
MTIDRDPLDAFVERIEAALAERLPQHSEHSAKLVDAMRYATLGGGKRIRPLLVCATATSLGADIASALAPACAIELIHAYSLVHDDLPAMDDDDLRRGRPTVHVAFGEATAILAGDALQALAFDVLANEPTLPHDARLEMLRVLARASGWRGMVGGQALDMDATGTALSLEGLERMHRGKTGALLTASVELGAIAAGADASTRAALRDFGDAIGLAFQIVDDLLDVTQTTEHIGKRAGADAAIGKNTFPGLLGIEQTRGRADELYAVARDALHRVGISDGTLYSLAGRIVERTR